MASVCSALAVNQKHEQTEKTPLWTEQSNTGPNRKRKKKKHTLLNMHNCVEDHGLPFKGLSIGLNARG